MKAFITLLACLIISYSCLLAQIIEQPPGVNVVGAKATIADTDKHGYVINPNKHPDSGFNKNHPGEQFQAAPANDNCSNAIALTVGAACVSGITKGSSTEGGENFACQGTPTQSVWYSFVATATDMYVEIDYTGGGCYFGSAVWSGSCLPSTALSCVSAASAASSGTLFEVHNLTGLTVGDTYYIQVTYTNGGACGSGLGFCIDVGVTVSCATCNNTCGPICLFTSNPSPTVAQVDASCSYYDLKPRLALDSSRTQCYTFTAESTTDSLQMIIYAFGCPGSGGNVTSFNWTIQSASCGAVVESGDLSNTYATGLTVGEDYAMCYTWTSACQGQDSVAPYMYSDAPLPIELVDFYGTLETDHVELYWGTASEINNDYFTVERSADRNNFTNIGRVKGAGNSSKLINYSFDDTAPLIGVSYYRLKQTDYDGRESYSPTIAVNSAGKDFVHIIPNPARDQLYINVNAGTDDYLYIYVCNLVGQQVYFKNTSVSTGMNQFNANVSAFSNGVYFLQVDYKDSVVSNRVMKE